MNDLCEVIKFSSIESYASKDIDSCLRQVAEDVSEWCCANHLLINPEKNKFVLFGVRQLISKLPSNITVPFLGQDLVPVTSVKDLGVTLDSNLTFNGHIASLTYSLLSTLVQINRARHLFSKDVLYMLNSLLFSKPFYCLIVWSVTSKENIHKLHLKHNFAGRIYINTKTFDHITPVLHQLCWLTIEEVPCLRDVTMILKCLNGSMVLCPATKKYYVCKTPKNSLALH